MIDIIIPPCWGYSQMILVKRVPEQGIQIPETSYVSEIIENVDTSNISLTKLSTRLIKVTRMFAVTTNDVRMH